MRRATPLTLSAWLRDQRGRLTRLADQLEVSPSLVSMWAARLRRVPAERCVAIQRLTGHAVKASTLRPDVFSTKKNR